MIGARAKIVRGIGVAYYLDLVPDRALLAISIRGVVVGGKEPVVVV